MNITVNGVEAPIVLRTEKNAELTFEELDGNFQNLALKTMENSTDIAELQSSQQKAQESIPSLDDITSRVTTIETLLNGTNLVVDDSGIVYDPNDVANKKPYFDTPVISLWNEKGEFNDTMLTVTSSTTVDADNQDYHINITAVDRDAGTDFPLDDKIVVDLSKYYDEFIHARRVHINGKLIINEGDTVGMSHIGGLTFLVYIGDNDSVSKVVKSSMMNFDDVNVRTKEVFIHKSPKVELNINIDSTMSYGEVTDYDSNSIQHNSNSGVVLELLFGTLSGSDTYPFTVRENSVGYHITFDSEELLGDEYNKFTDVSKLIKIVNEDGTNFVNDTSYPPYSIEYSWVTKDSTSVDYYQKNGWIESGEL